MKSKLLLTLASALVAATTLASAASAAGGGVRLGFGFPLGSFTATPAKGATQSGTHRKSAATRKAPAYQHAARKPDKSPRHAAKTPPVATATAESAKAETGSEADAPPRLTGSSALIQSFAPAEQGDADGNSEPVHDTAAAPPSQDTVTAEAPSGGCRKFVPAVGTTISVDCGD